jgi:putative DNA primase/helicase
LEGTEAQAEWKCKTVEASTYDRVVELARDGLSQAEITTELELNKSTVSRHLSKARSNGVVIAKVNT